MTHRMKDCPHCNMSLKDRVIYDRVRVTIHDEGYDGIWVSPDGGPDYCFTEPEIKFSSKVGRATERKPFHYRLTLVEDFDA